VWTWVAFPGPKGRVGHPDLTQKTGQNRGQREAANRYEWPCPGDLLHMDVCTYARLRRPGHRATGSQPGRHW
jgi:hypothetical protein